MDKTGYGSIAAEKTTHSNAASARPWHTFQKLRVSHCAKDENARVQLIFSGVSANSWLSPVGISTSESQRSNKAVGLCPDSGAKKPILASECRQTIQARAKSASSVMGRRHYEAGQQLLGKDQVLRGRSALDTREKNSTPDQRPKSVDDDGPDPSRRSTSQLSVPFRCSAVASRPQTCCAVRKSTECLTQAKRPTTSIPNVEKRIENCPEIQIKPALPKANEDVNEDNKSPPHQGSRQLGLFEMKRRMTLLSDSNIGFRSVEAMKEVFVMRMRSAHGRSPLPVADCQQCESSSDKKPTSSKSRNRFEKDNDKEDVRKQHPASRRPLKPLLYSGECDIKHSAGCPYNCRGCFRACLASEDFFDNMSKTSPVDSNRTKNTEKRKAKNVDVLKLRNPLLGSKSAGLRTLYKQYPENHNEIKFLLATEQQKQPINEEA